MHNIQAGTLEISVLQNVVAKGFSQFLYIYIISFSKISNNWFFSHVGELINLAN